MHIIRYLLTVDMLNEWLKPWCMNINISMDIESESVTLMLFIRLLFHIVECSSLSCPCYMYHKMPTLISLNIIKIDWKCSTIWSWGVNMTKTLSFPSTFINIYIHFFIVLCAQETDWRTHINNKCGNEFLHKIFVKKSIEIRFDFVLFVLIDRDWGMKSISRLQANTVNAILCKKKDYSCLKTHKWENRAMICPEYI